MRYWWVNQNQTFRQELAGGYLWSPSANANGARNPFYETMREVSPGDVIFSFVDTRIAAIGIAQSYCWEGPKPAELGGAGEGEEGPICGRIAKAAEPVEPHQPAERLERRRLGVRLMVPDAQVGILRWRSQ